MYVLSKRFQVKLCYATMEISFAIDICNDEKQSNRTKRRDTQVNEISAKKRSENICQIHKCRHIPIDQADIFVISENNILKHWTKNTLKKSAERNEDNNRPYLVKQKCSYITDNHSENTDRHEHLIRESFEPKRFQQKSLIDRHDYTKSR